MSSSLDEWQTCLEQHFEALAKSRSESGLDIFALEHGLDEDAVDEIAIKLRLRLKNNLRLSPHWLLWVIYSTEHGYRYEGDEYWPSFELQTPRWDGKKRYQLAQWFKKFQRTYRGVVPTGRWADHFSIISRPITHAVLPKYLQVQFARTLYYQRHRLIGLTTLDAGDIGRRLRRQRRPCVDPFPGVSSARGVNGTDCARASPGARDWRKRADLPGNPGAHCRRLGEGS